MQLIKSLYKAEICNYIFNIIIPCILPVICTGIFAIINNFRSNNEKIWKDLAGYSSREKFYRTQMRFIAIMLLIFPALASVLIIAFILLIPSLGKAYLIKYCIFLINIVLIICLWKPLKNEPREKMIVFKIEQWNNSNLLKIIIFYFPAIIYTVTYVLSFLNMNEIVIRLLSILCFVGIIVPSFFMDDSHNQYEYVRFYFKDGTDTYKIKVDNISQKGKWLYADREFQNERLAFKKEDILRIMYYE